jgi:hypothetical protein
MKYYWMLALAFVMIPPRGVTGQAPTPAGQVMYDSLKARLMAGDTIIDYRAFRFAFAETPNYDPFGARTGETREQMMNAFYRSRDMMAARAAADSLLGTNYVDIDAHMIAAIASGALGDETRRTFHASVARGLAASIAPPEAANSVNAPYEVIGVVEEDAMLRMHGWRRGNQSLVTCAGDPCDRIEVTRPATGESAVLYFDISRPQEFLRKQTEP